MGRVKDQWMAATEQAENDFADGKIEEAEFVRRMKALGFDLDEIDDRISVVRS